MLRLKQRSGPDHNIDNQAPPFCKKTVEGTVIRSKAQLSGMQFERETKVLHITELINSERKSAFEAKSTHQMKENSRLFMNSYVMHNTAHVPRPTSKRNSILKKKSLNEPSTPKGLVNIKQH